MRVSIIDDNNDFRKLIRRVIQDFNVELDISESESADQFFKNLNGQYPDIILMDIHMPGTNGFDATERIIKHYPSTKIIIISLDGGKEVEKKSLECGALGNIEKDKLVPDLYNFMLHHRIIDAR